MSRTRHEPQVLLGLSWQEAIVPSSAVGRIEMDKAPFTGRAIIDDENFRLDRPFWADYHPFTLHGLP